MKKDVQQGVQLFRKAARRGDPMGMEFFGQALCYGLGIERNRAKGCKYLRRAAAAKWPRAVLKMGQAMIYGNLEPHIPLDLDEGIKLMNEAVALARSQGSELPNVDLQAARLIYTLRKMSVSG